MSERAWHQALAYAMTGQRRPELGYQAQPDLAELSDRLGVLGADAEALAAGRFHDVPEDLMRGLGPAQFRAALTELRAALARPPAGPVVASRPLTTDERRLDADRPPHH